MSLIGDIQTDLLEPKARLSDILRKAKVLAYQLKSEELKSWTSNELDGYEGPPDAIPPYRVLQTQTFGHFSGGFGRELRNAPIPTLGLPDPAGKYATTFYAMHGIRGLESLLESGESSFQIPWPANNVVAISDKIYQGYSCMQAWWHISAQQIEQILDTVRNRLLTFTLELGQLELATKDEKGMPSLPPADVVSQVFNNFILGDHNVVDVGGTVTQHAALLIREGDAAALRTFLDQMGIPKQEAESLLGAIAQDGKPGKAEGFGPRVREWLGVATEKIASGIWKVAIEAAPSILAKALSTYYGWG